jgi:hypothetical protein
LLKRFVKDWREWAASNGYTKIEEILASSLLLEVWIDRALPPSYLLYLPGIPNTVGGETLYLIDKRKDLDFMKENLPEMVVVSVLMAQMKARSQHPWLN